MKNSMEFWSDVCLEVVRRDFTRKSDGTAPPTDQGGPTRTSRALAIAHLAIHDAWLGTTNPADTYLQRLASPVALPAAPDPISKDSAIGTAAAVCLATLYPSHVAYINRMSTVFIDLNPVAAERDEGHRYGEAVAHSMMALRANDKSSAKMAYRPSTAYGRHREDPYASGQGFLTPQWGDVARFCTPARVPLDKPPGYSDADYLSNLDYRADLKEVKEEGSLLTAKRKPEDTAIGFYWGYDGANEIGVPPRLYNQIARAWLDKHHPGDIDKAARLLGMLNAGLADAAIDAWYHKYAYNLWRPVLGIREAAKSTGPGAVAGPKAVTTAGPDMGDPAWAPLGLPKSNEPGPRALSLTPPFPAYPSGHATFGATLFQILQRFSGGVPMTLQQVLDASGPQPAVAGQEFDFVSDELNGTSVDADGSLRTRHLRQFTDFARPTWENAISRVYIGVHWRFDGMPRTDVAGKRYGGVPLGLTIGSQAFDFFS